MPGECKKNRLALDGLVFVLKISERCNIACKYCYFFFAGDNSYLEHKPFIEPQKVDQTIAFFRQTAIDYSLHSVTVSLHGGEPLLMKKTYFETICKKLREAFEDVCILNIATQTNAMLITEEWLQIFEKYNVITGVSIDGPPEVHDKYRLDRRGRGTYQKTYQGVRKLFDAKQNGFSPHVGSLTVINPFANGASTYRHIVDKLGINDLNFIIPHYNHDTIPEGAVEGVSDFVISAFREWIKDDNKSIRVSLFKTLLSFFVSKRHNQTKYNEGWRNQYGVITVASNGDLGPNDYIKPLDKRYQYSGLNALTHTFDDILTHEAWEELNSAAHETPNDCKSCRWYNGCLSGVAIGDLNNRFSAKDRFKRKTVYCEAMKAIFSEVERYLLEHGFPQEAIDERLAEPKESEQTATALADLGKAEMAVSV